MKRIRTWQLCRTGKFGADGATITEKDLREIEQTFTPPRPISIGHDAARADNFPKFGDVLAIDGIYDDERHPGEKVLVAEVMLHPELEKQFSDSLGKPGLYSGWSVTIPRRASDGKRYLHSLAICGAVPPKIPGLEQLMTKSCFSDGDKVEVYNFSDSIEYSEKEEDNSMTEEEKKKMEALEAENKKLKEEAEKKRKADDEDEKKSAEKSAEFQDLQKRCEELEKRNKESAVNNLTDRFADKIPAGVQDKVKAVAEKLAESGECKFSDGANTEKKTALEAFADVLDAMAAAKPAVTQQVFNASEFSDKGGEKPFDWNKISSRL